jgi:hypothetical protein
MVKKPTKDEIEDHRQRVEALKAEAKSYGVYCTFDRINDVTRVVNKIRKSREGKPPCYWQSYEKTARECRICEVRHDCARGDEVPAEIPTDELKPVACRKCASGSLSIELKDPDSGEVKDYGCTNTECLARLSEQQRHVETKTKTKTRPKPKIVRKPGGRGNPQLQLAHDITEHIRTNPGCGARQVMESTTGGAARKQKAINDLIDKGVVSKERAGRKVKFYICDPT